MPAQPRGKIVFTCQIFHDNTRDQICLMNADGSEHRRLTTNDFAIHFYPSISPDGESIVFSSNQPGSFQIFEMNLNGDQEQLTAFPGNAYAPTISPDGESIVFTYEINLRQNIWLMNRDGTDEHPLEVNSVSNAWDPVWSPDGSKILYMSDQTGSNQLFSIGVNGRGKVQITDLPYLRGRSDWSPAGFSIATYQGDTWDREIILVDLINGDISQITDGGNNLAPSFSPDGLFITFTSYLDNYRDDNGCEIYIIRLSDHQVTRLTSNSYCDWQPRWGN